jgi:uncharacterized protein YfdQ (DUF2303 family)
MIDHSTIDAISNLARQGSQVFNHPQGGTAVMGPDGRIHHIAPIDPILTHVKQNVAAYDSEAFVSYVNRFKVIGSDKEAECSTIFADPNRHYVRCIIDYHIGAKTNRCAHNVQFNVPCSEQWKRWIAIDGKPLTQSEFAEFIEENALDIVDPVAAVFLDLVTNLQSKRKVAFESGVRLQDGSHQLLYAEEVEAKGRGTMAVPAEFHLGVPIFLNAEAYKVRALLRYRINEGSVAFIVKLHRRLFLEQTAFKDVCNVISAGTGLPVLNAWT